MKNKTIMKIISICFIFIVIFNMTGNIFAAVNKNYGENEAVIETNLEDKLQNSVLLEAIALLVYGVGSLVETLVGGAFQLLTGQNIFPWADKVIFNTIPFLDINFLNPSKNSLFLDGSGSDTALAIIVRNMYFTILIIAIGFLGIVVGLMAIRLAISSIAAEKAKYKQAITKFLVALIMLFCVHYAISFIFYVNESLVEIASSVLTKSIDESGINVNSELFDSSLSDEEIIENFFENQERLTDSFDKQKDKILGDKESVAIASYLLRNSTYKKYAIPEAYGNSEGKTPNWWPSNWHENDDAVKRLINDIDLIKEEKDTGDIQKHIDQYNEKGVDYYITKEGKSDYEAYIAAKEEEMKSNRGGVYDDAMRKTDTEKYKTKLATEIMPLYQLFLNASTKKTRVDNVSTNSLITEMALYFKENAWTYETDEDGAAVGWDNNSVTLQGALLYAIFVIQSVIYFFAYIKRFFYVVILSLLAPIIVIYDFLGKAIM